MKKFIDNQLPLWFIWGVCILSYGLVAVIVAFS